MTSCPKNCDLDLTALAAGDLPRWRAIPLRRHLRSCAQCAATYAEIEALFSQAHIMSYAPSDNLKDRTWTQIAAEPTTHTPAVRFPQRRAVVVSLVGSAVAASAVAATLLLPPGAPLAPTPSFAMVEKAMAKAQSVEFHLVDTRDNGIGKSRLRVVDDVYIAQRLNPPVVVMATNSGESQSFYHIDENASYGSIGNNWNGKPEFFVSPPQSTTALQNLIRRNMTFNSGHDLFGIACNWGPAKRVLFDGHPALRFDGVSRSRWTPRNNFSRPWNASVWADPVTLHFLRYESSHHVDDNFTESGVASEFVYDHPDSHSLLTKTPPVGTPLALLGESFAPATAAETQQTRDVVDAALSAWKTGDWNRFVACCDGGDPVWNRPIAHASRQPLDADLPESTWKQLVETKTHQPWNEIKSVVKTAVYTLTLQSTQDKMPYKVPNNVLVARTSNVWFFLKPTSDAGLKIFHITYTGGGPVARPKEKKSMGEWP